MLGAECEFEFSAIRGALIKLFPDTIISQEKRSVPDRNQGHVTDRKPNDRFKNRFRKPRDGKSGRHTAHETDARDTEDDPNYEEEESGEEETDLTAAFEREVEELASVVEELKHTSDFQSPCMRDSPPSVRRKVEGENEESRLSAFLVCLLSRSFRFTTVILERQRPRKKENETKKRVC